MLLIEAKEEWDQENWSQRMGRVPLSRLAKLPRYLQKENQLQERDWGVLQHPESILSAFEVVVKRLEGDGQIRISRDGQERSYGNIWNVILAIERLFGKLEELKQQISDFPDAEYLRIGVNLAWEKLNKCYRLLDETPIYYTALALYSAYRWSWFEDMWQDKPEWVIRAKNMVHDVWIGDYAYVDVRVTSRGGDGSGPPIKRLRYSDPYDDPFGFEQQLPE
jgi:hypothetical protein